VGKICSDTIDLVADFSVLRSDAGNWSGVGSGMEDWMANSPAAEKRQAKLDQLVEFEGYDSFDELLAAAGGDVLGLHLRQRSARRA